MNSLASDLSAFANVMGPTQPVALVKDLVRSTAIVAGMDLHLVRTTAIVAGMDLHLVRTTAIVAGMDLLGLPGSLISPADSPLVKAVKAGAVYVAVWRISDLTGAVTGF